MLKLKQNHTQRDVKNLTDQLVDAVNNGSGGSSTTPYMQTVLLSADAGSAQTALGISDFAKTLLDDTSATAALSTLGVSSFAKTLLSAADSSTALTDLGLTALGQSLVLSSTSASALSSLGVSSFAQTVLDDTSAGAALTTLGVSAFAQTLLDDVDAPTARATLGAAAATSLKKWDDSRNILTNGNFDHWRYTTSQTISGYGSADRWFNSNTGSTKVTSQQSFTRGQTAVPGAPIYYQRTVVTSVANRNNGVLNRNSTENAGILAGKLATLTFWAKADANRPIAAWLTQYFGDGGSTSNNVEAIGLTTFNLTTAWQQFQILVTIPAITGKIRGTNLDDTLDINFLFDCGSNYLPFTAPIGQQSGTFDLARISLVEGDATGEADPFPITEASAEMAACCRYYNFYENLLLSGYNAAAGLVYLDLSFTDTMTYPPDWSFYNITYFNATALANNADATVNHHRTQAKVTATAQASVVYSVEYFAEL